MLQFPTEATPFADFSAVKQKLIECIAAWKNRPSVAQSGELALAQRLSVEWIDGDGAQCCASEDLG